MFGTDGIRGVAGKSPLTQKEVFYIGCAAADVLRRHVKRGPIQMVLVRDTRESGGSLAEALTKGLRSRGIHVFDVGILGTPSVAYFTKAHHFHSGVVISASHNPPAFNGIKFFTGEGRKWPDEWERSVEEILEAGHGKCPKAKRAAASALPKGRLVDAPDLVRDYEKFLIETLSDSHDLSGLKIGVDCSHGANFEVAPRVFRKLGAYPEVMGAKPNGRNINVRCGSQETGALAALVKRKKCHCGVAFDGDGDRVIFVDEKGKEVDGDFIIALLAKYLRSKGKLKNQKVVITVMANLGLKHALRKLRVRPVETPVGDRYVSDAMKKGKAILGGEQSGHIILGDHLPSGDGLLTALHVLTILKEAKRPFSKLVGFMKKYPQVLVNVPVREKKPIAQLNGVQKRIDQIKDTLGNDGRILVRYSGTEPLLRIMIEGETKNQIEKFAEDIRAEVENTIGASS